MKRIGVTQRVENAASYSERRDCLDQQWAVYLAHLGYTLVPIPNLLTEVERWVPQMGLEGIVLSGGNDLASIEGGENAAPERDATEKTLIEYCTKEKLPLLGVCRGMQFLLSLEGVSILRVEGHVGPHLLESGREVNSFHGWGIQSKSVKAPWLVTEQTKDGIAEAVVHKELPQRAVMWHPERGKVQEEDLKLFVDLFGEK